MRVNTRYINSTSDASSKKDAPQWHIYPTFRAHSATQVCTGIRQNQILFKTGHSPLISKLVQHFNKMSVHGWWKRVSVHGWWKRVSCQSMVGGKECQSTLVEESPALFIFSSVFSSYLLQFVLFLPASLLLFFLSFFFSFLCFCLFVC